MIGKLVVIGVLVAMTVWAGTVPKEDAPTGTPAQIAVANAKVAEAETAYARAKAATENARRAVLAAELEELRVMGQVSSARTALFLLEETPAQRKAREERQRLEQEHYPKPTSGMEKPG